ncbi:MAG TPA: aspartate kinase [bacterium]|nr:aspartate kinase [bacterium]HPS29175.1 aspartate kinase [bacterium]
MRSEKIVVLKFGGSSLKDDSCLQRVISIISDRISSGYKVVTVVSARGKTTESLLSDAKNYAPEGNPREFDMLLTTGERASAALVAMALSSKGIPSISLTGSQAGIITDDNHTNARIIEIRPDRVISALKDGLTVIVGGFQGVSFKKEVTTLGRGGSDTTAVALAAALDAELCEIFSDVDGVYSADPAKVPDAYKIDKLSYQEMQELSEAGAQVLHSRAIEFAKEKGIAIHCKSTFDPENPGTVIHGFEKREKIRKAGVAYEKNVVLIHAYENDAKGLSTINDVLCFCRDKNSAVKQISFHKGYNDSLVGSFILSRKENYSCDALLAELRSRFAENIVISEDLSAVSIVGEGITDRSDTLLEFIRLMRDNNIALSGFHTSSFRISLLVNTENLEKSLNLLHKYCVD